MAKLMLNGDICTVRIFYPGEYDDQHDETYVAYCEIHDSIDEYDSLYDAADYAADHADYGPRAEPA
jgi:hypothetical protein